MEFTLIHDYKEVGRKNNEKLRANRNETARHEAGPQQVSAAVFKLHRRKTKEVSGSSSRSAKSDSSSSPRFNPTAARSPSVSKSNTGRLKSWAVAATSRSHPNSSELLSSRSSRSSTAGGSADAGGGEGGGVERWWGLGIGWLCSEA